MSGLPLAKLNRATKHIEDLQLACDAFFDSRPYEIAAEDDVDAGKRSYRLISAKVLPDEIALICGDALHNLRSALDHLAYSLVVAEAGTPTRNTCFPIVETAQKYNSAETGRKIKGMGQKAIDTINAVKPYKGGDDTLWRLHRLNARDKHHLLVTVGTAHLAHSMTPTERQEIVGIYTGSHPNQPLPNLSNVLKAAKPVRILKAGEIIHTVPISELEQNMTFHFAIAFNETGIVEGEPIIPTLHEMKQHVAKVILRFWGLC